MDLQGAAQGAAGLDQGQGIGPVAQAHMGDLIDAQQHDAVPLGESIGQQGRTGGLHPQSPGGGGGGGGGKAVMGSACI